MRPTDMESSSGMADPLMTTTTHMLMPVSVTTDARSDCVTSHRKLTRRRPRAVSSAAGGGAAEVWAAGVVAPAAVVAAVAATAAASAAPVAGSDDMGRGYLRDRPTRATATHNGH